MLAVELGTEAAPVVDTCRQRGLLVNAVTPTALRLVPPLIITPADVDEAVDILDAALAAMPPSPTPHAEVRR
jgi:acetylornithine/succinyldiaminopimelate/putrescine aminotransferase